MEQHLTSTSTPKKEEITDDLSFVKLHSILCFLMTRFYSEQCPKLAHFIVRHIGLVIEHPDVVDSSDYKNMYLQVLQQWQKITADLLEQQPKFTPEKNNIH